jgi:hypothetical protein
VLFFKFPSYLGCLIIGFRFWHKSINHNQISSPHLVFTWRLGLCTAAHDYTALQYRPSARGKYDKAFIRTAEETYSVIQLGRTVWSWREIWACKCGNCTVYRDTVRCIPQGSPETSIHVYSGQPEVKLQVRQSVRLDEEVHVINALKLTWLCINCTGLLTTLRYIRLIKK